MAKRCPAAASSTPTSVSRRCEHDWLRGAEPLGTFGVDSMIEVRSAYVVRAKDIRDATALWREGREKVWPQLEWGGRLQQMLHGHCQQSLFVWSSTWSSMAEWEAGMKRTGDVADYKSWSAELNKLRLYGAEREVFTPFGSTEPLDGTPGRIEIRSAYSVRMEQIAEAKRLMTQGQNEVWPAFGWSGQNQQMLHGRASQSQFVWTSTWESLGEWETAMARTGGHAVFQPWYQQFLAAVDTGSSREIFRNL